jgi:phosphomannomutase
MNQLKQRISVGVVGGSDLVKQQEQLGQNIVNDVDYSFSGRSFLTSHSSSCN